MTEQAPFFSESGSSPPNIDDPRLPERTRGKIRVDPDSGCWAWLGASNQSGHGRVWLEGRMRPAHRVVYETLVGPVPTGLVLDHAVCDNPACCNPAHLRVTTQRENVQRGRDRVRAGFAPSTHEAARRGPAKRETARRHRARMIAEGRCEKCGSSELETKYHCARCAERRRERRARRRAGLVAAGLCLEGCGRPLAPGSKSRCSTCLAQHRVSDQARLARARASREAAA